MILEVADAVSHVAPGLVPAGGASVACIQTTRPKYLVFGSSDTRPICVVQFGPETELRRLHSILERLEPRYRGHVPRPIVCGPWQGTWVQIQSGLGGVPWFKVRQDCTSVVGWLNLEQRALASLRGLQDAVRQVGEYAATITPADELERQVRQFQMHQGGLPDPVEAWCASAIAELRGLGTIIGFAQHGDYSLNNLLTDGDGEMHVIDFDEFGLTHMPLHDEAGLALSMSILAPALAGSPTVADYLNAASRHAAQSVPETAAYASSLILHHLLWRLNACAGVERRSRLKAWLLDVLHRLSQDRCLSASAE